MPRNGESAVAANPAFNAERRSGLTELIFAYRMIQDEIAFLSTLIPRKEPERAYADFRSLEWSADAVGARSKGKMFCEFLESEG